MALATQCPHCRTTFRVSHDQLKLRAGLVRCGACKQIFNGIEHLLRPDKIAAARKNAAAAAAAIAKAKQAQAATQPSADSPVASPPQSKPASTAKETRKQAIPAEQVALPPSDVPKADPSPDADISSVDLENDPLNRMTLMDFTKLTAHTEDSGDADQNAPAGSSEETTSRKSALNEEDSEAADQIAKAIGDLQRKPWRHKKKSSPGKKEEDDIEEGEPGYIAKAVEDIQRKSPHRHHAPQKSGAKAVSESFEPSSPSWLNNLLADIQRRAKELWPFHDADEIPVSEPQPQSPPPAKPVTAATESEEPSFVTQSREQEAASRTRHHAMSIASAVLALILVIQVLYTWRSQLAVRLPGTKPVLSALCVALGCEVSLPMQSDAVSIESNPELQSLVPNKNAFALTMLLRNRGSIPQAWPHIELTLNDGNEKTIVRKVFTPQEYMTAQDIVKGFPPNSEQPVKISFELLQLKASGYRVYLFYP